MAAERVDRRLAAVLAADVAGYSRLMATPELRFVDGAVFLGPLKVAQAPPLF